MAFYRNISISFWTDSKIDDEFTPEDKYFYLYLLTNPHTNICGCYEISVKQMERETGYNEDTVKRLLKRMEQIHKVVKYDSATKEIFVINWSKYNWSGSDKVYKAVTKVADKIKSAKFKKSIMDLINNNISISDILITDTVTDTDTAVATAVSTDVSIGYQYPIDTLSKKPKNSDKNNFNDILADYTQNKELIEVIKSFAKYRKAIKAPLIDRALTLFLNKLDKLGNTDEMKIALVEQALERGWKTVYPLKDEPKDDKKDGYDASKYEFLINNFDV